MYHSALVWAKMDSGGKCDGNVISRAESLIAEQVKDSNRARVGVNSLNFLSKQPIVRDLSNIKQL